MSNVIEVGVLGATGMVGQHFVRFLGVILYRIVGMLYIQRDL